MENTVEEFDIQLSVLKKRNVSVKESVYVEYDRINYSVIALSPVKIQPSVNRNEVEIVEPSDLTNKVFGNKISLSKLVVKKNKETSKFELKYNRPIVKSEFDYIFATTKEKSYIHINCDVISKNLEVVFDYEIFNFEFGSENLIEKELENFPENIKIYCIDNKERSKLYDTIVVPTSDLFEYHSIRFPAKWLPDDNSKLTNVGFVYYNDSQRISAGNAPKVITDNPKYKSNVVYNQAGDVLKLQSNMQNIKAFHINEDVMLYMYAKNDLTRMLGSCKISRDQFNNYNYFEIKMKTSEPVKLITDCFHLQLEESYVNTD